MFKNGTIVLRERDFARTQFPLVTKREQRTETERTRSVNSHRTGLRGIIEIYEVFVRGWLPGAVKRTGLPVES